MKGLNDKRLGYLYQAVTLGSVHAAADKLDVALSAVSRQISLLEQELATTLIERHRLGVTSTDAGDILLNYYRKSLSSKEACLAKLQAVKGLHRGHIKLAVGEGFVGDLMAGPIPSYPNVVVSLAITYASMSYKLTRTSRVIVHELRRILPTSPHPARTVLATTGRSLTLV